MLPRKTIDSQTTGIVPDNTSGFEPIPDNSIQLMGLQEHSVIGLAPTEFASKVNGENWYFILKQPMLPSARTEDALVESARMFKVAIVIHTLK